MLDVLLRAAASGDVVGRSRETAGNARAGEMDAEDGGIQVDAQGLNQGFLQQDRGREVRESLCQVGTRLWALASAYSSWESKVQVGTGS